MIGEDEVDNNLEGLIGFSYQEEYDAARSDLNAAGRITNERNRFRVYNQSWGAMCTTCPAKYNVYNDRAHRKRKRVRLPLCLESVIRSLYPEYSGLYTGFKSRRN